MSVGPGRPSPLGATWDGTGVNFAIFSEHAERVELCLFDSTDARSESRRLALPERTGDVWHGRVSELGPGQLYGYRVHGPHRPEAGHRFDPGALLVDPYARTILPGEPGFLSAVVDPRYEWGDDLAPRTPWHRTVLYETHVKGLTARHPDVPPELRGTYAGLATEPILRHLGELGVTAIELLPVHQHADEPRLEALGLTNYWGYNTLGFFAPDARYCTAANRHDPVREFREMVRALHARGFELILDVVYNHTAEGDHLGPTLSFRGIDNLSYYRLLAADPRRYEDLTGCGNTLDVRHSCVLQLILDSLRYWVLEMHVDGFRFDLAPALGRTGRDFDTAAPFFEALNRDPVLSQVKRIAEPWDLGSNGYRLGQFPAGWSEWNDKYRDAVRGFWRGDGANAGELATRISGSRDLFARAGRGPSASINFVTCHDGFTLADLVSYAEKHNEANGEENRDGNPHNLSWNHGVEGPTDDPVILAARRRDRRNLFATLMLSLGVPMISGGDELGRTQRGNNNAYCHDAEWNWYDWAPGPEEQAFLDFARRVVALCRDVVTWRLTGQADQGDSARTLALVGTTGSVDAGLDSMLLLINGGAEPVLFRLPATEEREHWELWVDTAEEGAVEPERVRGGGMVERPGTSLALFRLRLGEEEA